MRSCSVDALNVSFWLASGWLSNVVCIPLSYVRANQTTQSVSQSACHGERDSPHSSSPKNQKCLPLGKVEPALCDAFHPFSPSRPRCMGTLPPSPPHNVRTRADTIAGRRARGPWKRRRGVACGVESACSAAKPSNNTQPWPWVLLNLKNTPNGRSRTSVCRGAQPTSAWDPSSPGVHP
jgi:hypothetical protein